MNDNKTFLGTGWSFPPSFDRISNAMHMSSDVIDIEESIRIILDTVPGERLMQPDFGCHIKRLVFEKLDSTFVNEANDIIRQALLKFEPRVRFVNAEVIQQDSTEGIIYIQVNYTVIITNTRHNIVYPFYFQEGTNVTM